MATILDARADAALGIIATLFISGPENVNCFIQMMKDNDYFIDVASLIQKAKCDDSIEKIIEHAINSHPIALNSAAEQESQHRKISAECVRENHWILGVGCEIIRLAKAKSTLKITY